MKKRTAFIGAILSLISLWQPLLIKTGVFFPSIFLALLFQEKLYAGNTSDYLKSAFEKVREGEYYGAIADYSKAIEINSNIGKAYTGRGFAKEMLEDYKGAIFDYTKAIKINPKDIGAYIGRCFSRNMLEDYKGALSDCNKVIKLNPRDGDAFYNLHILKKKLGDYDGAISDRNKSFMIDAKDKIKLSPKDIIEPDILNPNTLLNKQFKRIAEFKNKTFQKPIKYYIHDQSGKTKFKILPSEYKYSYQISDDEEKFINDTLKKVDTLIDLDFIRVYSPNEATIRIYKTNKIDCCHGITRTRVSKTKLIIEIGWSKGDFLNPKMKSYPTLAVDDANALVHEIGHALGLAHDEEKGLIDPNQRNINNRLTSMSYNNFLYPVENVFFTNLDISALQKIWGVEKDN